MDSNPACEVHECEVQYTESLCKMLAGLNASVNLVAEEEEGGEENRYFNVARVNQ